MRFFSLEIDKNHGEGGDGRLYMHVIIVYTLSWESRETGSCDNMYFVVRTASSGTETLRLLLAVCDQLAKPSVGHTAA